MFGLTVSAAATDSANVTMEQWHQYAGEPVFTYTSVSGDVVLSDAYYDGWSSSFSGSNFSNQGDPANINANGDALQIYGAATNSDTLKMPGFGVGNDFVMLEFMHTRSTGNNPDVVYAHEFAVKDADDKIIETGFVSRHAVSGVDDGLSSGKTTHFTSPTPGGTGAAGVSSPKKVSNAYNSGTRIVFVNNDDNTYSVIYYLAGAADSGDVTKQLNNDDDYKNNYQNDWTTAKWTKMYTATYTGQFNGIGSIDYYLAESNGWGHNHRMKYLKIYTGDVGTDAAALDEACKGITYDDVIIDDDLTMSGENVTWSSTEPKIIAFEGNKGTFTAPESVTRLSVFATVEKDGHKKVKTFSKIYAATASKAGKAFEQNGVTFNIDTVNKVSNGDFADSMTGWTGGTGEQIAKWETNEKYGVHGNGAARTGNPDDNSGNGANGSATIRRYVPVDSGKSYYVSYYTYSTKQNGGEFTSAVATKSNGFSAQAGGNILSYLDYGGWSSWSGGDSAASVTGTLTDEVKVNHPAGLTKYEYVVYVPNDTVNSIVGKYIMLSFGAWSELNTNYYSDFEVYEATPANGHGSVTVNFWEDNKDGQPYKTFTTDNIKTYGGLSYSYDAAADERVNETYTSIKVPEQASYKIDSLEAKENVIDIVLADPKFKAVELKDIYSVDGKYYETKSPNIVPNPSFELENGSFSSSGWYSPYNATAGNKANNIPFEVGMRTESKTATAGTYSFASHWGDPWDGRCSILNNFKVEAGKKYYFAYDVYRNCEKARDTELKNDKGSVTGHERSTVTTGVATGVHATVNSDNLKEETLIYNIDYQKWITNARIIDVPSDNTDPYVQFNAYFIGNSNNTWGDNGKGDNGNFLFDNFVLVEVEEVPAPKVAPKASLGWNGSQFTIDFVPGEESDGEGIKVYGADENGSFGDATVIGKNEVTETGVTLTTNVPNRIYKAVATTRSGEVEGPASESVSLYSLVVKDIIANVINGESYTKENVDAARLKAANDIIAKGGIFYETEATDDVKGLITVSKDEDGKITAEIAQKAVDIGIGFVLDGNTIYFGSDDKNSVTGSGTYTKLVITSEGTLDDTSVKLEAADGSVITLGAVNIEFVETLIEELEAAGADADVALTPEL